MFSSRFSDKINRVATSFLQHRCTHISYLATGNTDEGGHPTYNEVVTSDIPCLFLWAQRSVTDERGTVIETIPTIYFRNFQTLKTGDLIRNVLAKNGTTVLLSAAKINTIDGTAEGGNNALKVCELEGAIV